MTQIPREVPRVPGVPHRRRSWAGAICTGLAVAVAAGLLHSALTWQERTSGQAGSTSAASPAAVGATTGATGTSSSDSVAAGAAVATPTGAAGTAAALAAAAPLPVGDLPGWHQVFTDDFTTDVAEGRWASSGYAAHWLAYDGFPDTHAVGAYSDDVLSVSDGLLDMRWHTVDGVPRVSGVIPLVDGVWGGHVGGRYSVRFRADASAGYVAAFLLWPDSNVWDDGEVDFAEGDLDGGINAYHHCPGDGSADCGTANTRAEFKDWHVATVEWTATEVTYLLDGYVVQRASQLPTAPMHLVLQGFVRPGWDATRDARVQVDWVSVWYPDGS